MTPDAMAWPGLRLFVAATLAILALLVTAMAVRAQGPVTATTTVDRTAITMGDRILLTLTIDVDSGFQVTDPGVQRVIGDFEIIDALPAEQSDLAGGGTRAIYRYQVTTFQLGDQRIAPINIPFTEPNGLQGVARTNEHVIRVASVVRAGEDTADIKPLKPQLELPGGVPGWLTAIVAAVAVMVLAGLGYLMFRLLRRFLTEVDPDSLLTPHQRALRELGRVAEMRLPEQGNAREHYELMAQCLRRYVLEEFGVAAPERTTRELRAEMVRAGVDRYQALMIDEILIEREVVVFGNFTPSSARSQNAIRVAIEVISEAKSAAEQQAAEAEKSAAGSARR